LRNPAAPKEKPEQKQQDDYREQGEFICRHAMANYLSPPQKLFWRQPIIVSVWMSLRHYWTLELLIRDMFQAGWRVAVGLK
jgi:hypothetical protein